MNKTLYDYICNKQHHKFRKSVEIEYPSNLTERERAVYRFRKLSEAETPVLLEGEKICFLRTVINIPPILSEEEHLAKYGRLEESRCFVGDSAGNWTPNYEKVLQQGFYGMRENASKETLEEIDLALELCDRYLQEAKHLNRTELVKVLSRAPREGATSFHEALQLLRIIHFFLRMDGCSHLTFGRFDKYMYPYYKNDVDNGILTQEEAFELLEDFFLSLNRDTDLYWGVQKGDNGQSIVLGGMDENGNEIFNELSKMCLRASKELMLIDPKLNIRVSKNTPLEIYELGSELTAVGLGFPQYSNDDIVIPGLVKFGYEYADAVNYGVAACWEFIVPSVAAEPVNKGVFLFPRVVNRMVRKYLLDSETFDEFLSHLTDECEYEYWSACDRFDSFTYLPAPLMESVMDCDIYSGGKYKNMGMFGVAIATAADSLAAIEKYIYNEKRFTKEELIHAIDYDFEGHEEMLHVLRYEAPKMGNDDDCVDRFGVILMDALADTFKDKVNCWGGKIRTSTGTSNTYLTQYDATPDGRRKNEPFGTNYSPSLFAKIKGPISLIKSFTKPDLGRNINGGPLTVEFHHSLFSDKEAIKKVASFVKSFIDMGGHQIQLNVVNVQKMREAQKNPEMYRQLVVRIWGWSAVFVDLDEKFQNHVIHRQEYNL